MFALPLVLFLCIKQPIFYTPDEQPHFIRAYQVSNGEWFPQKFEVSQGKYDVGGMVEGNINHVGGLAVNINQNKNLKVTDEMEHRIASFQWSQDTYFSTPNVSIYPPFLYFPQATGILIGKTFDLSIATTTTLSRIFNAISALLISLIALRIAKRGTSILFVFLILPMTLAQFASNNQDALCISLSALCAALITNIDSKDESALNLKVLAVISLILILISTSRPPYLAFSAILFALAIVRWDIKDLRNKLLGAFTCVNVSVILWTIYVTLFVSVQFGPDGISYEQQLGEIANAPFSWMQILIHTWITQWKYISTSFVGNLGYMDVKLPLFYYWFSASLLIIVVVKNTLPRDFSKLINSDNLYKLFVFFVLLTAIIGIYLVLYVSWTPVGHTEIFGVQGRYLIPVALFLGLLASVNEVSEDGKLARYQIITGRTEKGLLLTMCIVTFLTVPWVIAVRFY